MKPKLKLTAQASRWLGQSPCDWRRGVTLVELLIVIMIIGLLTTAALKAYDTSLQAGRYRTTMRQLDEISAALVGNPDLIANGVRTDFGVVADIGYVPDKLPDLVQQPTGLDTGLWNGPYLINRIGENPQGYMFDAWGDSIVYNRDSLTISSRRGMSILLPDSWITRRLARSSADLLRNDFAGIITDNKGNPPLAATNLKVSLSYPVIGRHFTDSSPDIPPSSLNNGNFRFTGRVTAGNQELAVRLITADVPPETFWVRKTVQVIPGGASRNWVEIHMPAPF
jgi:prepilin-type N-terminal cleavage/methylation domain-containing protein